MLSSPRPLVPLFFPAHLVRSILPLKYPTINIGIYLLVNLLSPTYNLLRTCLPTLPGARTGAGGKMGCSGLVGKGCHWPGWLGRAGWVIG